MDARPLALKAALLGERPWSLARNLFDSSSQKPFGSMCAKVGLTDDCNSDAQQRLVAHATALLARRPIALECSKAIVSHIGTLATLRRWHIDSEGREKQGLSAP